MGKLSEKKAALTRNIQKIFLQYAEGQSYENQYRSILKTGLRTGESKNQRVNQVTVRYP